jgi:DNA mismatch repair protein MutL
MSKIRILPENEARKIAAGEVVERPASVVKELLENALDAQATEISLHLINGGKSRIEIRDNGCGMSPEDARLCIEHHATSKLQSIEQLTSITTFGFRGEALASIASVSIVEIITRQAQDEAAIHLRIEAGMIVYEGYKAANVGTTIIVENLFFNVPARKKFMKQRDTEWRAIQQLAQATALTFPELSLQVTHDDQAMMTTQPCTTLLERAQQIFGKDVARHVIPLATPNGSPPIKIEGVITTHQISRYDRRHIFCFINRRWVKNHILGKALLAGYNNVLPAGKFPSALLSITIPAEEVDVNIHPRKEEVMLLHPHLVSAAIETSIQKTLHQTLGDQLYAQKDTTAALAPSRAHTYESLSPFSMHHASDNRLVQISAPKSALHNVYRAPAAPLYTAPFEQHEHHSPDEHKEHALTPIALAPPESPIPLQSNISPSYHIIGQFAATYLLIEVEQGLLLVDQHAAHECIIYQELVHKQHESVLTKLLFPEFITLAPEDFERIAPHIPHLTHIGIEAEIWGNNQIMVTATITQLKHTAAADIIFTFLKEIDTTSRPDMTTFSDHLFHHIRALIACKSAVKAGDHLSAEAQYALIEAYLKTEDRRTCPHGRPTSWLLSLHEFERKFKRTGS